MNQVITHPASRSSQAFSAVGNSNPMTVIKVFLYLALAILILFVLVKVLKGVGKFSNLLGEFGPKTEKEKLDIVRDPNYSQNLKWLDDKTGIDAIVKSKKYKKGEAVSDYMLKKGITWSQLSDAAESIYKAKVGPYTNSTEVYNAISSLPSKAAISLLAFIFKKTYEKRIGGAPLSGFLSNALGIDKMQALTSLIGEKPNL